MSGTWQGGKHGIRELADIDFSFFVLSQEEKGLILRWFQHGTPVFERKIRKVETNRREGVFTRGVMTSDPILNKNLPGLFSLTGKGESDLFITFDGPQRRQILLKIEESTPDRE